MNHGANAWIVWGVLFDHMGGPNHASNWSHTPVMAQVAANKLIISPSYYYIAQVSKYVRPGARRLASEDKSGLISTSFENPDGSRVLVVLNATSDKRTLRVSASPAQFLADLHPRSITTFTWPG